MELAPHAENPRESSITETAVLLEPSERPNLDALVQLVREQNERERLLREQNAQLQHELTELRNQLHAIQEQLQNQARPGQEGNRRVVTVLFADLRDSTGLAESLPPDSMIRLLNSYVGALARCVHMHGGFVDKFFGDGLMAYFPFLDQLHDPSEGAVEAARAALEMRHAVRPLNDVRVAQGFPPIGYGVGIHTGEVVFGLIGMRERSDYTILGDTVNTAARLSGLCSTLHADIVMSDKTANQLRSLGMNVRELGAQPIRGKKEPITTYTLR